jgi:hypothetical protein
MVLTYLHFRGPDNSTWLAIFGSQPCADQNLEDFTWRLSWNDGYIMGISSTIYRGYTIWYRGYTIWYTIWYTPYIMGITSIYIYIYIYHQYDIGGMVIHPLSLGWGSTNPHKHGRDWWQCPNMDILSPTFEDGTYVQGEASISCFMCFFFQMHKSDKTRVWSNMSLDFTVHHFFFGGGTDFEA